MILMNVNINVAPPVEELMDSELSLTTLFNDTYESKLIHEIKDDTLYAVLYKGQKELAAAFKQAIKQEKDADLLSDFVRRSL